jgi:hypothetical protein
LLTPVHVGKLSLEVEAVLLPERLDNWSLTSRLHRLVEDRRPVNPACAVRRLMTFGMHWNFLAEFPIDKIKQ